MEWKEYSLGDVCDLIAGYAFKARDFGDYPHKVLRIGDINPPFVNTSGAVGVDMSKYDSNKLNKYIVTYGDFILAMTGATIGKIGRYIDRFNSLLNQRVLLIKPKLNYDSSFVYYIVSSSHFQQYVINHIDSQSAQPNISANTLSKYVFRMPSTKEEQTKVASILKSLDDKIENNRKINENLEQQAQALFKSWFVDFEPFRDQPFVDSELGMIPESLKLENISALPHTLETGRRPKGGVGQLDNGVPSVGAEHVKGLGNYDFSKTKYITEEYAKSLKTGKINGYELLIYKDGGKPGYFIPNYSIFGEGYPYDECYLNEHVFKLDFDNKGFNAFCYFYFKTDYIMHFLNAQGSKAAIPGINRQDIESIPIYSPSNEKVIQFSEWVLPLIKTILINSKESQHLAKLRDTLLPKLMNGELKTS